MFRLTKLMRSDLMIFNVHVFSPGPFKGGDFFINMSDARSQSHVSTHCFPLHEHKDGCIKSFLLICSNKAIDRSKLQNNYCRKYMCSQMWQSTES